jgi:HD-like signal output (HDOD) protein
MKHSLLVSKLAEAIATTENTSKDFQGQCATAGLLHDMGKLLLSTELPEQYEEVLAAVKAGQQLDWEVENSLLETTHGEVGAYLLGLWGLSGGTIEAIAFHHTPAECPGDDFTMLEAIHAADYFEYKLLNLGNGCERELDMVHLRNCGLEARVPVWEKACANVIDEVKRHEQ